MEKNEKETQKSDSEIKKINDDEIILFSEGYDKNGPELSESSVSNAEEMLTFDEYYLECARFGELKDLKEAMKEADKSFDVNIKDFRGNTALHMACANGHIEMVKYLINTLHVDINIKNSSNNTPLGWAALNGQKEIVKILLANNADYENKNSQGKTPSEIAYDTGNFEISEMIVQKEIESNKDMGIQEEDVSGQEDIMDDEIEDPKNKTDTK